MQKIIMEDLDNTTIGLSDEYRDHITSLKRALSEDIKELKIKFRLRAKAIKNTKYSIFRKLAEDFRPEEATHYIINNSKIRFLKYLSRNKYMIMEEEDIWNLIYLKNISNILSLPDKKGD